MAVVTSHVEFMSQNTKRPSIHFVFPFKNPLNYISLTIWEAISEVCKYFVRGGVNAHSLPIYGQQYDAEACRLQSLVSISVREIVFLKRYIFILEGFSYDMIQDRWWLVHYW